MSASVEAQGRLGRDAFLREAPACPPPPLDDGSASPGALVRHARRAAGQASALATMIDAGEPFPAIAQQLRAARGSLDSLLIRLVNCELDRLRSTGRETDDEFARVLRAALGPSSRPSG